MEKKTKLWLGAGLVAVAGYLLWKSKQANTTTLIAPAPTKATTATGTSNMVGFSTGDFYKPDNEKFLNASAAAMQVPASKDFFKTESGKFGVDAKWAKAEGLINTTNVKGAKVGSHNAGIFANQPFNVHPKEAVSKKMTFAPKGGPVVKNFAIKQGNGQQKHFTSDTSDKVKNASGKFFQPQTAKYGDNQGVFAPSAVKALPIKQGPVTQAAPTKMLVGYDGMKLSAANKAMLGFSDSSKIWA